MLDEAGGVLDRVDPWGARAEWLALPRKVRRAAALPLWPTTTSIPVGSPTKQPSGRGTRSSIRAISGRTPRHPISSSYEIARWIGVASSAATISGRSARQTARNPFMSEVPRP